MIRSPDIDILGSNVLMFKDQSSNATTCKVMSYPTLDQLIKFNMLFSCCIAHPTAMFRVSSLGNKIVYNTEDPDIRSFEDYELWLRLIHS